MQVSNMTTLLPFRDNAHLEEEDNLISMNILMKLNNEQLLSLLGAYTSDNVKLKVVVKDGKINGLRIVPIKGIKPSSQKVEIVKCNLVKETNGIIYHDVNQNSNKSYAVNLGPLDYRLNLINYKPNSNQENLKNIQKYNNLVKIIQCVADNVSADDKSDRIGLYYDERKILKFLTEKDEQLKLIGRKEIENLLNILKPNNTNNTTTTNTNNNIIEWKWFKMIRSFKYTKFLKKLFQEGYRSSDSYLMIYSGRIDPNLMKQKTKGKIKNKELEKDNAIYNDTSTPTSPNIVSKSATTTSKSRTNSDNSTFSRSTSLSTSESRHTTPPVEEKDKNKDKEKSIDIKSNDIINKEETKEIKKTKRSFKEYQLAKGLNSASSSTPASPIIKAKSTLDEKTKSPLYNEDKIIPSKRKIEEVELNDNKKISNNDKEIKKVFNPDKLPKGPRYHIPDNDTEATELVKSYQTKYLKYYKLYQKLKTFELNNQTMIKTNIEDINKLIFNLIEMQNELESIKWRLGIYTKRNNI